MAFLITRTGSTLKTVNLSSGSTESTGDGVEQVRDCGVLVRRQKENTMNTGTLEALDPVGGGIVILENTSILELTTGKDTVTEVIGNAELLQSGVGEGDIQHCCGLSRDIPEKRLGGRNPGDDGALEGGLESRSIIDREEVEELFGLLHANAANL